MIAKGKETKMKTKLKKYILNCHMDDCGIYEFETPKVFDTKEAAAKAAEEDRSQFLHSKKGESFMEWYDDNDRGRKEFSEILCEGIGDDVGQYTMDDDCNIRRVYSLAEVEIPVEIS